MGFPMRAGSLNLDQILAKSNNDSSSGRSFSHITFVIPLQYYLLLLYFVDTLCYWGLT